LSAAWKRSHAQAQGDRGSGGCIIAVNETRKLAAILVADVVGYSRLAGADEDRILARPRTLRSDLIDPTIAVHHGRIVKRTGDGSIIEFRSVVDAVNRAIEVQRATVERNAEVTPDKRIEFRIGRSGGSFAVLPPRLRISLGHPTQMKCSPFLANRPDVFTTDSNPDQPVATQAPCSVADFCRIEIAVRAVGDACTAAPADRLAS
jgi:hypothetical protein